MKHMTNTGKIRLILKNHNRFNDQVIRILFNISSVKTYVSEAKSDLLHWGEQTRVRCSSTLGGGGLR